jgi:hypothetical protein
MVEFRGRYQWESYLEAVRQVESGTISPGGATRLLRCSRQYIWELIGKGEVRAWAYYEEYAKKMSYVELSLVDLIVYGLRVGRIKQAVDIPLGFPNKQEIFDQCRGRLLA